jgi:hypothetical protein
MLASRMLSPEIEKPQGWFLLILRNNSEEGELNPYGSTVFG